MKPILSLRYSESRMARQPDGSKPALVAGFVFLAPPEFLYRDT